MPTVICVGRNSQDGRGVQYGFAQVIGHVKYAGLAAGRGLGAIELS